MIILGILVWFIREIIKLWLLQNVDSCCWNGALKARWSTIIDTSHPGKQVGQSKTYALQGIDLTCAAEHGTQAVSVTRVERAAAVTTVGEYGLRDKAHGCLFVNGLLCENDLQIALHPGSERVLLEQ